MEFTRNICLHEFGDTEWPARWSVDTDDTVRLEEVQLNGLVLGSEQVIAMIGQADHDAAVAAAQAWYLTDGWASVTADDRAYWMEAAE